MAFSTYAVLLYTGLGILQYPNELQSNGTTSKLLEISKSITQSTLSLAKRIRAVSIAITSLTAVTIISGAFVAGNDAGNAYNTFPKMNDQWIPYDDMVDPALHPSYRNAFENTAMVQWNHRVLGSSTAFSAITLAAVGILHPGAKRVLTPQAKSGLVALGTVAVGQVSLGIATLLNYVPITLAATHQLGSLVLLSSGIYVVHTLRYVSPRVIRLASTSVKSPLT
jgi:cytochrome c oxidase assembly protein subunit 15